MNKSDHLNELAVAMAKFQGDSSNAYKGKEGHGYNYADLGSILNQVRSLLAENGLSVVQMPCKAELGSVGVETIVLHSSGQWISQSFEMQIPDNKRNSAAQNTGSAITYARRYALAAALGIGQTDEDASEAIDLAAWFIEFSASPEQQATWPTLTLEQQNYFNDKIKAQA